MIDKLVLEFIENHDPMSKEILLDKITERVDKSNFQEVLKSLDSIKDITNLEYSMVINSIAKPGLNSLLEIIDKKLQGQSDQDVIEELVEAKSKIES